MSTAKKVSKRVQKGMIKALSLEGVATMCGLTRQTYSLLSRERKIRGIFIPPDTTRGREANICVVYKQDFDGLTIKVVIPYDEVKNDFKKTGEIWINIEDALPRKNPTTYLQIPLRPSAYNVVKNFRNLLELIQYVICNRPLSQKTGKLMDPFFSKKTGEYFFVAKRKGIIVEKKSMFTCIPLKNDFARTAALFTTSKRAIAKRRQKTGAAHMSTVRKKHKRIKNKSPKKTPTLGVVVR